MAVEIIEVFDVPTEIVEVLVSGPQGPAGEAGAGLVASVNGETGVVVLDAADVGAAADDDSRLSDTRDPNAHAASHAAAGSDPVFDQDLNTTDDVTFSTINAVGDAGSGLAFFFNSPINFDDIRSEDIVATTRTNLGLGDAATANLNALPETLRIVGGSDPTKKVAFEVDGLTTATTRTLTVPNASGRLQVEGQPIGNTTPAAGTFTTLAANNGTLTASAPVLDLSQTWNNAAVTFTGLRFNATDTASASNSILADFQRNGSSFIRLARSFSTPYIYGTTSDSGVGFTSTGIVLRGNGGDIAVCNSGSFGWAIRSDGRFEWAANTNPNTAPDLQLFRDAADTLAQRRGTNPQTFRLYNTYTDASNHERGFMRWSSNVLQIGTEKAGTGSSRDVEIFRAGQRLAQFTTTNETNNTRLTLFRPDGVSGQSCILEQNSGSFRVLTNGVLRFQIEGASNVISGAEATTSFLSNTFANSRNTVFFGGGSVPGFRAIDGHFVEVFGGDADAASGTDRDGGPVTIRGGKRKGGGAEGSVLITTSTGTNRIQSNGTGLGFFAATPAAQPAAVADATDAASTQARLNDLLARLRTLGLIAT